MLLRWQHKNQLIVDLGWASQFNTDDNEGLWNDWIIGNGVLKTDVPVLKRSDHQEFTREQNQTRRMDVGNP